MSSRAGAAGGASAQPEDELRPRPLQRQGVKGRRGGGSPRSRLGKAAGARGSGGDGE